MTFQCEKCRCRWSLPGWLVFLSMLAFLKPYACPGCEEPPFGDFPRLKR